MDGNDLPHGISCSDGESTLYTFKKTEECLTHTKKKKNPTTLLLIVTGLNI